MLRVGMLTSGGDCQALNATMRAIVKTLAFKTEGKVEVYGFLDGYQGLIYNRYTRLSPEDFAGSLTHGGTILGTSRTPFKELDKPTADGVQKVPAMVSNYRKLGLDCLFMLGGNGSTKTANRLSQEGLNVIALPKTIDNDTWGTDMTFGFTSAVEVATKCIDDIRTTATSHGRVFVIEIMGHKVGWIPLYAGVAGPTSSCCPRSPTTSTMWWRPSTRPMPTASVTPSSWPPRAPSPRRTPRSPRRSTRPNWPSA